MKNIIGLLISKQPSAPVFSLVILSAIWIILVPIKSITMAPDTPLIYFIKVTVVLVAFFLISLLLILKARYRLIKSSFLSDLLLAILISTIFAQFLFSESNFVLNGDDIHGWAILCAPINIFGVTPRTLVLIHNSRPQ